MFCLYGCHWVGVELIFFTSWSHFSLLFSYRLLCVYALPPSCVVYTCGVRFVWSLPTFCLFYPSLVFLTRFYRSTFFGGPLSCSLPTINFPPAIFLFIFLALMATYPSSTIRQIYWILFRDLINSVYLYHCPV